MNLTEYNNNPGNLRPPKGVTYEGQIGVDEHGFAVFEKPEYGRNALVQDIKSKFKQGLRNPNALIDKYTPAGDENSEESRDNYKIHIAHGLGLDNTKADFPEDSEEKIADLIASFEGGKPVTPKEKKQAENAKTVTQTSPDYLGGVGAVTGAAVGAKIRAGQAIYNRFWGSKDASGEVRSNPIHPSERLEPVMGELTPSTTNVSAGEPTFGNEAAPTEVKPAGGKATENWMKSYGADPLEAKTATSTNRDEGWSDIKKANKLKAKIAEIAPEMKFNPNAVTPYGFYLPESAGGGPRGGPRTEPIVIPPTAEPVVPKSPLPVQPSAGEQLGQKILGALSYFSLPAKLAASGYETGFGAQDVQNKLSKEDKKGAALSAAEHGSLAVAPWLPDVAALAARYGAPRIAAGLSPLGLAIPAGWSLYDVYKNSYLPVSSEQAQSNLAKQYPDNTGNPMAQP
jgi:hypothetical protein